MNLKIPLEKHKKICDKYLSGKNTYRLANEYNVNHCTINNILHKYNVKICTCLERFKKDKSFFEKIDTEEKAYFLGLLYADGYNGLTRFAISLQIPDIELIKKFKKAIKYSGKIKFCKRKNDNCQILAKLTITSVKMCSDLTKLGCIKAKSLILKFPTSKQVPDYLIHHFIRGYFDGDGCIHIKKDNNQPQVIVTSSKFFCESLKNLLKNEIGMEFHIQSPKNTKAKSIVSCGSYNIKSFFDYIYKDANFFLKRKYKLFLKSFKLRKNSNKQRYKNKHSKFFGVTKYKSRKSKNKWTAKLNIGKRRLHIGCFATEIEAAKAYNGIAKKYKRPINNLLDKNSNIDYYLNNRYINK